MGSCTREERVPGPGDKQLAPHREIIWGLHGNLVYRTQGSPGRPHTLHLCGGHPGSRGLRWRSLVPLWAHRVPHPRQMCLVSHGRRPTAHSSASAGPRHGKTWAGQDHGTAGPRYATPPASEQPGAWCREEVGAGGLGPSSGRILSELHVPGGPPRAVWCPAGSGGGQTCGGKTHGPWGVWWTGCAGAAPWETMAPC